MKDHRTASPAHGVLLALAVALALALPTVPAGAQAERRPACAAEGDAAVAALHRNWILIGWDRKAGDGPFSFREKLGRYYDFAATDVILYDDMAPGHRVARSAAEYGALWEPIFSSLRSAVHRVVDGPFVVPSGDVAASTLLFAGRLEAADGTVTGIRTFTSLVWRCTGEGWKIAREHNSSVIVPADQIDALVNPAGAG